MKNPTSIHEAIDAREQRVARITRRQIFINILLRDWARGSRMWNEMLVWAANGQIHDVWLNVPMEVAG